MEPKPRPKKLDIDTVAVNKEISAPLWPWPVGERCSWLGGAWTVEALLVSGWLGGPLYIAKVRLVGPSGHKVTVPAHEIRPVEEALEARHPSPYPRQRHA